MFKITKGGTIKFNRPKSKAKGPIAQKGPAKGSAGAASVKQKPNPAMDAQKAMVPDPVALVPARQKRTPRKQGPY